VAFFSTPFSPLFNEKKVVKKAISKKIVLFQHGLQLKPVFKVFSKKNFFFLKLKKSWLAVIS
jgi:hypothetical protein